MLLSSLLGRYCGGAFLLVISLGFSNSVCAQEAVHFHNLGFSPDGRYFSYAESGRVESSELTFANVSVIEIDSNSLIEYKSILLDCHCEEKAVNELIKTINFKKFRLIPFDHQGIRLIDRPPEDLSYYPHTIFSWPFQSSSPRQHPHQQWSLEGLHYSLTVRDETSAPGVPVICPEGPNHRRPLQIKLEPLNSSGRHEEALVLREGHEPPLHRGECPHNYQIRHVLIHDSQMIIGILYTSNKEGEPRNKYLVVSRNLGFQQPRAVKPPTPLFDSLAK